MNEEQRRIREIDKFFRLDERRGIIFTQEDIDKYHKETDPFDGYFKLADPPVDEPSKKPYGKQH